MLSFKLCSDEDLEAIFYHLDFPGKCKLRRCSRRWNRLLRSATALHTVVFHLVSYHGIRSWEQTFNALSPALPHVVNLALIAATFPHRSMQVYNLHPTRRIRLEMPAGQHHERRLYLCNFFAEPYSILRDAYRLAAFNWIELRDMTFLGPMVKQALIDIVCVNDSSARNTASLPLQQNYTAGVTGLRVHIGGSYLFKNPANVVGRDTTGKKHITTISAHAALLGLIQAHVRHLTDQETETMLKRLCRYNGEKVQAAFVWLLKLYEPDLVSSPVTSFRTFNYKCCSVLVGRVLACYDNTTMYPYLSDISMSSDDDN